MKNNESYILKTQKNRKKSATQDSMVTVSEKKSVSHRISKENQMAFRFSHNTLKKLETSVSEPLKENYEDEILSFFIHTADLSGAAKKFELSKIWAKKINEEFSAQYVEEISLGITQTPHFKDLHDEENFHKNECGFRKFIILPLYQTMKSLDEYFFKGFSGKSKGLKLIENNLGMDFVELFFN